MPVLKVVHVISFSSEDKVHVADNILGTNTYQKWTCATPGENTAVLYLQLEKASVITGIDIGNEHSAYIEVLVSRHGEIDSDYKTLLIMSSFMTASESRQSQNVNKVRMFKREDFMKPVCDEKWDRIKIVCTQPFNRHVKYGLSFIKFHSNETNKDSDQKFLLRPDSPVDLNRSALLVKKKRLSNETAKPLTAAAAIRAATSNLLSDSPVRIPKLLPDSVKNLQSKKKTNSLVINTTPLKPRTRDELFYTEDEEKPHAKIDRLVEKKKAEKLKLEEEKEKNLQLTKKNEKKKQGDDGKEQAGTSKRNKDREESKAETGSNKRESFKRKLDENSMITPKKTKCTRVAKPFEKLLEDVVLVISGIQNPDRATLRGKILEMGAKYMPDWNKNCTHLVCAFMNTPKFNQVRGKGKIVTRKWIEDCHSLRRKLPWRRYALDKAEKDKDESEDEIWEQINEISKPTLTLQDNDIKDVAYDDTMEQPSDTEDIVEQIKNSVVSKFEEVKNPPIQNSPIVDTPSDPYSAETDTDEETEERKKQIKNKPFDFFKHKCFFIDSNFEDYIEEMLKNYIFIHEGSLADDPMESIDYIICGKEEAHDLKAVNTSAYCILPDWIVDCHKCKEFIPPDEYFVL